MKLPAQIKSHPSEDVLIVAFQNIVPRWCLGLCLLKEGLIQNLQITGEHNTELELRVISQMEKKAQSRASLDSKHSLLELNSSDLDYIMHFFLKAHRDGRAEVDHLDLEISSANGKNATIVFKVPEASPSVSPEEARRLLDM
jgi:hypothetical protein